MTPIQFVAQHKTIVTDAAIALEAEAVHYLRSIDPHDLVSPDALDVDPQGVILRAAIAWMKERQSQ